MKSGLILALTFAFAFLFISSLSSVIHIKKNIARSIRPEAISLEILYFERCEFFNANDLSSVQISTQSTCLPVLNMTNDVDDLHADYFCSNVGSRKSLLHFVEIYQFNDSTPSEYVFSFQPSAPFRIITQNVTAYRR